MPVTSYYSIEGEILGERTDAGTHIKYGVDALGSVTSTMVGDSVVNRYAYKPYGSLLSKSGVGADPAFQWVGTLGYRQTGRSYSESYVRARHYAQTVGRWSTVDLLWPEESAYCYGLSSPAVGTDPSGLLTIFPPIVIFGCNRPGTNRQWNCSDCAVYPGVTKCCAQTGLMFTLLCAVGDCTRGCTAHHEAVHFRQGSPCCALAGKCYKKAKKRGSLLQMSRCQSDFDVWFQVENEQRFECEAYTKSAACFKRLYDANCKDGTAVPCCSTWIEEFFDDQRKALALCWRPPALKPCPFDSEGNRLG